MVGGGLAHVPREASGAVDPHLRFQLPESVLPMQVERIRLVGQLDARLRQLTISGKDGETFVEIHRADDVLGPIQIELAEQRFLHLDARGGLHLRLTLSDVRRAGAQGQNNPAQNWKIEYLQLEVVGRTAAK